MRRSDKEPARGDRKGRLGIGKGRRGWEYRRHVFRAARNRGEAERYRKLFLAALAEADRKFLNGDKPACTIRGKLEEFLSDSRAGLGRKPCAWGTIERHRRRLIAFDRAFHTKPLDAITSDELERWVKRRLAGGKRDGRPVGADSVNMDLVSLRAFCRWAQKKHYAPDALPIMTVERLRTRGKLAGQNRRPPEALEIGELLDILRRVQRRRRDVGLFLFGMLLFGLRPTAVAELRRGDAKLPRGGDPGRLHCRGLKGMHARDILVPLGSKRHEWLVACLGLAKAKGKGAERLPLVPCKAGKSARNPGGWTTASLDMALKRICGRLGLRFTAYKIRHTCASWLQTQLRNLASVQAYAGHARVDTQNAYSHRHGRDAEPAYEAMEGAMKSLCQPLPLPLR